MQLLDSFLQKYKKYMDNFKIERIVMGTSTFHVAETSNQLPTTYEILKCSDCCTLMKPPIFKCGFSENICYTCKSKYKSTSFNRGLTNLALRIAYPCKWQDCDYYGGAFEVNNHEEICERRIEACPVCKRHFLMNGILSHLQLTHKYKHLDSGKLCIKLHDKDATKNFVVFTDNEIVCLSYKYTCKRHVFSVKSTSENKFQIYVFFKHRHCKLVSQTFVFSNELVITSDLSVVIFKKSLIPLKFPDSCKRFGRFVAFFTIVERGLEADWYSK